MERYIIPIILVIQQALILWHSVRLSNLKAKHEEALVEISRDILTITGCPTRTGLKQQKTDIHSCGYFWTAHTDYAEAGQPVDPASMLYGLFIRRIQQGLITEVPPGPLNIEINE